MPTKTEKPKPATPHELHLLKSTVNSRRMHPTNRVRRISRSK